MTVGSTLSARPLARPEPDEPRGLARRALARLRPGRAHGRERGPGVRRARGAAPRGDPARVGVLGAAGADRARAARTDGPAAFARDGRSLYVVQFFTDTNHDGVIDASDHGVLFRVPISFAGDTPVAGPPEQLTETSWNCEYPAPSADRLIATCSQDASLDVYSLPLDGEVPADWTMPRLVNAIEDAGSRVEQQLLASRRLARETTPTGRRRAMLELAMLHLEREEYRAAEFYAEHVDTLRDEATAGISLPLRMLVEQRRAARRREQGRMIGGRSAREARERLDKLHAEHGREPDGRGPHAPRAERDRRLDRRQDAGPDGARGGHRRRDDPRADRRGVLPARRRPLPRARRSRGARRGVPEARREQRALGPTSSSATRAPPCARWSAGSPTPRPTPASPASAPRATARELGARSSRSTSRARARDPRRARAPGGERRAPRALRAQTRPGRRRALMADAVQRADDVDADDVLEALAQRDIEDVKRGTRERGEAEDVLRAADPRARVRARRGEALRRRARRLRRRRRADGIVRSGRRRDRHAPQEGGAPGRDRGRVREARDAAGARALREGLPARPAAPEARRRGAREGGGRRAGRAPRVVVGAQGEAHRAGALRRAAPRGVPADRGPRRRPRRPTSTI